MDDRQAYFSGCEYFLLVAKKGRQRRLLKQLEGEVDIDNNGNDDI